MLIIKKELALSPRWWEVIGRLVVHGAGSDDLLILCQKENLEGVTIRTVDQELTQEQEKIEVS